MQDFLADAAAKLGIGADQAAGATGSILDFIKENASSADVSEMLSKIPGASDLMGQSSGASGGAGVLGALGGLLGGDGDSPLGGALGAADLLAKSGLSLDKLGGLLELLQKYVQPLLGEDLVKRLLSNIPGLSDLLK